MQPYKLIQGSNDNVAAFETAVSTAIGEGYEFVNRLITKVITDANGVSKVLFFQPMVFEEVLDVYEEDTE